MATRYEYNYAWDAGARTIASLAKDGCFTFSVPKSAIGVVCGLNSDDRTASKNDIRYGFLIDKGRYCIIENGLRRTALTAFPFDNTLFKVERVDGVIRYYVDEAPPCSGRQEWIEILKDETVPIQVAILLSTTEDLTTNSTFYSSTSQELTFQLLVDYDFANFSDYTVSFSAEGYNDGTYATPTFVSSISEGDLYRLTFTQEIQGVYNIVYLNADPFQPELTIEVSEIVMPDSAVFALSPSLSLYCDTWAV